MEREELDQHEPCSDCGALISEGLSPRYDVEEGTVLCVSCAMRRGGQYDGVHDRWTVMPDVTGLIKADERA